MRSAPVITCTMSVECPACDERFDVELIVVTGGTDTTPATFALEDDYPKCCGRRGCYWSFEQWLEAIDRVDTALASANAGEKALSKVSA